MVHNTMYSDDEESQETPNINYKLKYRELKKNLRYLIYENECFQDELRKAQRNFVSISRDKSFLLDRILKYEKPQGQSSDSEATESSDEDDEGRVAQYTSQHNINQRKKITKRKKSEAELHNGSSIISESHTSGHGHMSSKQAATKPVIPVKKAKKPPAARKPPVKKEKDNVTIKENSEMNILHSDAVIKGYQIGNMHVTDDQAATAEAVNSLSEYENVEYEFTTIPTTEGHMTREEVERHLESRRFSPELNTTATVPAELFSHEPDPESDFEDSEICEFIQLEEDATSADMVLE